MLRIAAAGLAVACLSSVLGGPARADETGFAQMHDIRREGNKLCMSDHWHYGSGGAYPTRKAAEAAAAQAWASFTAFEYGTTWANFSLAANRKFDCSSGPSGISCNVEARPCRAGGRR